MCPAVKVILRGLDRESPIGKDPYLGERSNPVTGLCESLLFPTSQEKASNVKSPFRRAIPDSPQQNRSGKSSRHSCTVRLSVGTERRWDLPCSQWRTGARAIWR